MIIDGAKKAAGYALFTGLYVGAVCIAPFVSIVAAPIFALKALPKWVEHRSLYKGTLTNLTREPFGRVPGQDYTRWDGKATDKSLLTPQEVAKQRKHALIGEYVHGNSNFPNPESSKAAGNPFALEDRAWLEVEKIRVVVKKELDENWGLARAFAKAIIPIVGLFWVLKTETVNGGACMLGCPVCLSGENLEDTHWGLLSAIEFQTKVITSQKG